MSHSHSLNRRHKFIQLALTGHERILPTNGKYPAPRPEHACFCKLFHFMEHVSMNILACWSLESILGPLLYCSHHSLEHSVLSACFQLDPLILTLLIFLFYMSFDTTFTCFTCSTVSWFQRSGNPNPIPSIHYWHLSQQLSNKRRHCTKLHLLTHLQSVNRQDFTSISSISAHRLQEGFCLSSHQISSLQTWCMWLQLVLKAIDQRPVLTLTPCLYKWQKLTRTTYRRLLEFKLFCLDKTEETCLWICFL